MIDVEINAFPRIKEYHPLLVCMVKHILASPGMESLAHAVGTADRVGIGTSRRGEGFAFAQMIFGIVGIDACEIVVIIRVVSVDGYAIVATIA